MLSTILREINQLYTVHSIQSLAHSYTSNLPFGKYGFHITLDADGQQIYIDISTTQMQQEVEENLDKIASMHGRDLDNIEFYLQPIHRVQF